MIRRSKRSRSRVARTVAGTALMVSLAAAVPAVSHGQATSYPSDTAKPDLVTLLNGYDRFWQSSGVNDLRGTVLGATSLATNDELAAWINGNATPAQQFRALQDSEYDNGGAYDQSVTISDGLGSVLGPIYVQGRQSGALPLTTALINSQNGTTGAYVSTGDAKAHYSYPRPYLPTDATATPVPGDAAGCAPSIVNASSLQSNRAGKSYADAAGNLKIKRVPDATDTTHAFSPNDVVLSAAYGTTGICTGGSYPSGHTTTAYQAGITLATLLPELAPQVLARASEAGNNRIVLGVHYPLDIVGGRIDGEVALATRWSDPAFRSAVLQPARTELVNYLESKCGGTLAQCIAKETSYRDDPYGGAKIPGGTAQTVTDRASAATVYHERLTYGFAAIASTTAAASVPANAQALLLTAFPGLTDAQRTSVLAQTEIASGYPLDGTGTAGGSWQRLDLAAALSAGVVVKADGSVSVVQTGGTAQAVPAKTVKLTAVRRGSVAPGAKLKLAGSGFVGGERATLVLSGRTKVKLKAVTANAGGRFTATVTIPRSTTRGAHAIDAVVASGASTLGRPLAIKVAKAKHP